MRVVVVVLMLWSLPALAHDQPCENETPDEHAERIGFEARRRNHSPWEAFGYGVARGMTFTLSDRVLYLTGGENNKINIEQAAESYPSADVAGVTSGIWMLGILGFVYGRRGLRWLRKRVAQPPPES